MGKALLNSRAFGLHKVLAMNNVIVVDASYSHEFRNKATALQGQWKRKEEGGGYWVFPMANEKEVRQLLLRTFGDDGLKHERCTVDIELDQYMEQDSPYLMLGSLTVAMRTARDAKVRLHKDAKELKGRLCDTGGSSHGAVITYTGGTVIRYSGCPMEVYRVVEGMPGIHMVGEPVFADMDHFRGK